MIPPSQLDEAETMLPNDGEDVNSILVHINPDEIERITPIAFLTIIQKGAKTRIPLESVDAHAKQFFGKMREIQSKSKTPPNVGDELLILAAYASYLSNDPIFLLLHWGVVIFEDSSVCLNPNLLANVLQLDPKLILKSLKMNNFNLLEAIPFDFFCILKDLGFIDSLEFLMFTINPICYLSIFLTEHQSVVQPFPLELVDYLNDAKTKMLEMTQRVRRKFIRRTKIEIMKQINGESASQVQEDEEHNDEDSTDLGD
ncbi:hypothetical protein GPJ56_001616 [Histomonas meleagridis]|uniref:uncharacterized protein n=1 Tax=Histomonas meleagridis TaxID=135588 RepID=UPI00355989ED|nr:hypothetical protein GPJ56_001616 [Histomonas meleagridis]KAH0807122.1 hypothetical protein GO595_000298 [Histomonas meleagridis]